MGRVIELSNRQRVELSNLRMVEWLSFRTVDWLKMALSDRQAVETSIGGMV